MADIKQEHLTQASDLCVSTDGKYTVSGDGILDDLMEAVNIHLDAQYKLGRITGDKYADVYLGSMQFALQNAVAFVLGEQKADKEAELLTAQEVKVREEIKLVTAQIDQTHKNTLKIQEETKLLSSKIVTETLIQEKLKSEKLMIDAQAALTEAKICTEKAQACGPGPVEGTVLYAQMELYKEQKDSFVKNSEQKFLKTVLDAWSVNANVMGVGMCEVGAFQSHGLDSIIREAGNNVGISVPGSDGSICEEEAEALERARFEAKKDKDELEKEKVYYDTHGTTVGGPHQTSKVVLKPAAKKKP
jgi:hypothetical protein